ncbi:glycoside hydrolase family 2 TIM barrel-domain containing protein [Asticcacaulis machinosus]|uniref:Glycoside hydrolase family 2 TIM barrel-domain containing protein n=1 Tax=Asticcacaulis machinosus TaxID=2984211 RepID=A0ABT5HH75_9CAUL|nr:glycoside hydrolase family 2 TIM barrel-domain containing protein [Asticcacaulis machinosus]MDC7675598.1 glycoside hydrolase family 2 TIM barrel-domain containing protein [Asticcacaulis machinosus]
MRYFNVLFPSSMALLLALSAPHALAERINLSQDWRFTAVESLGSEPPAYSEATWKKVSVPHDFSVMDKPDGSPPFDKTAISGQDSGYLPGGIGWYRRDLTLSAKDSEGVVLLHFEAIYMDADIWVNGQHVSKHHYGYTAFTLDLTGKVKTGNNTVVVRVNHTDPSSRWYAGSGIIRPVHLETLHRIHIDSDGPAITTPIATETRGEVVIKTPVINRSENAASLTLESQIVDVSGRIVSQTERSVTTKAASSISLDQTLSVENPALWSTDAPNLYYLKQTIRLGDRVLDERKTRFGIRTITVDAQNGLRLNGKSIELRGGNIHHDNYMLGAAGLPDADARKVWLMKSAGYNAIRSAHNPASQATLDAADELGLLVIDEAFDMWNKSKKPMDYSRFFKTDWKADVTSMVVSGRNHPSVVFWSIGNEIPEQTSPEGIQTARMLAETVRKLDPSRPVTQGVNVDSPHNAALLAELDVAGLNYRANQFAQDHIDHPERVMYTSESTPKDAFRYWRVAETMPSVIGDFVWTAVDYLGETGIGWMGYSQDWQKLGPYPWHLAYCGEIDATGRKRPAAFYRQVLWKTGIDPVSIFVAQPKGTADLPDRDYFPITGEHLDWSLDDVHPSWTWRGQEGKPLDVVVYSEFPEVELFLNGKSLGKKAVGVDSEYKANFAVPYKAGTLKAIGYLDGKPAGQWELKTAGDPASVRVTVDKQELSADGQSLAYVTAELLDGNGVPIYARDSDLKLSFKVSGAGQLAGAGSGNPMEAQSLQSGHVKTFHGRAVGVVKSHVTAGAIQIEASAEGLPSQILHLNTVSTQ